jgi:hypothetical protein
LFVELAARLALAYHNAQLQAQAFREEFDPDAFEDLTAPKLDLIHKVNLSSENGSNIAFHICPDCSVREN